MHILPIYKNIIKEGINGKHLVVVDIQPEYERNFGDLGIEFSEYLNENHNSLSNLTFLYNGEDTLGMISELDYKYWWLEQGLNEDIINYATFYDKGYAFMRYCIDEGIDEQQIINLTKYMMRNNINDSRELTSEFWDDFSEKYGDVDIRELLEFSDDMINIPDLMDELLPYNNIVLCGGGVNECLKEVEISLSALNKNYNILDKYTF